jgi:hypothetical protein
MRQMIKVRVKNVPVRTCLSADVQVEDGPPETLQTRIADALRAGEWVRAGVEEIADLDLEADREALDKWEFEV